MGPQCPGFPLNKYEVLIDAYMQREREREKMRERDSENEKHREAQRGTHRYCYIPNI